MRRLEVDRRVVKHLIHRSALIVTAEDPDIRSSSLLELASLLVGLGFLSANLTLQRAERAAEVRVLLREHLCPAIRGTHRVDDRAQLLDARHARLVDLSPQHVEAIEVEVRGVLGELAILVIESDVAEEDCGLLEAIGLVVDARATVLDRREVVGLVDVADVAIECLEHPFLKLRQFLRREFVAGRSLAALCRSLIGATDELALGFPRNVLLLVQVVVAKHRGIGSIAGVLTLRVQLDDRVERRTALTPLFHLPKKLGVEVGDLVLGRPVPLVDVREGHLLHLRELLQEGPVEHGGLRHRLLVVGARRLLASDCLAVPGGPEPQHGGGGLDLALRDRVGWLPTLLVGAVDIDQALELDDLFLLRPRRDHCIGDFGLPVAKRVTARRIGHQLVVDRNRLGPLAGVVVELG